MGSRLMVARIVETEAYRGDEPACHAFVNLARVQRGLAPRGRSALLFDEPGLAYVYLNYGVHWLFNVVTERAGVAGAVLVRAAEPQSGVEHMRRLRPGIEDEQDLASGPGKLTRALDIGPRFNGRSLCVARELWLAAPQVRVPPRQIEAGPRVGISKAQGLPWRFCLRGHPCVS